MKKFFLTLLVLVGTMSMDAQIIELYKGDKLVAKYDSNMVDKVVLKKESILETTGKAMRADNIEVNWVQLWEDGPKFAEYNIGAKSVTEYGGSYTWGGTYMNGIGFAWLDDHNATNTGSGNITGTDDTATFFWGDNWRMPTREELNGLKTNCKFTWTVKEGTYGVLCTGKDGTAFESNSIFLPAAGYSKAIKDPYKEDKDSGQGINGYYWSSTPSKTSDAYNLYFSSSYQLVYTYGRSFACSVRAVLNEPR